MPTLNDSIPPACRRIQALAERDPRHAVPLARRGLAACAPYGSLTWAWAAYTLGWALLCWERFEECRPHLQAAYDTFRANGLLLGELRCRYALLVTDLNQSARPELEDIFTDLAEQFEQAGEPIEAARTRLHQAVLLNTMGRSQDAETLLKTIDQAVPQENMLDHARIMRTQGFAISFRGDHRDALELLTHAEDIFTDLHYSIDLARCWCEQASVALNQERLQEALAIYQRAKQHFCDVDLPYRIALCEQGIGLVLIRLGSYDRALESIRRALTQFKEQKRDRSIGGCLLNLGNIYLYTGQWEAALAYYIQAEGLYLTTGSTGYALLAQRNQAMVYRAQSKCTEALALLAKAKQQAQAISHFMEVAEIVSLQAGLLADTGHENEALLLYEQAHDLFVSTNNLPAAAECLLEQGWLALGHQGAEVAHTFLQSAALDLQQHPHHRWRIDYGLGCCAAIQGHEEEALDYYLTACTIVAGLRRKLTSEEISSSLYAQAARLHTDAMRLAARMGATKALLEVVEEQRALVLQHMLVTHLPSVPEVYAEEYEALRQRIGTLLVDGQELDAEQIATLDLTLAKYGELLLQARHSMPSAIDMGDALPELAFDLEALRTRLAATYGDDWTALVYVPNGESLLILTVTPAGLDLAQTPDNARLRRLVQRACQRNYGPFTYRDLPYRQGQTARPWDGLRELADRLVPTSVRSRLHAHHRLLVVPAGSLHGLPWAALRLEDGWLIERAIVQVLPSLTTWELLSHRRPTSDAALLLGCSDFGERAAPLPGVATELEVVAQQWSGRCVCELEATRASLLDRSVSGELASYALLHIASHARLLPERGLAAHLRLHDGDLLLPEVAALRLDSPLVTLSACDGAAPDILPGEEVLSLSWALLAAGANAVLASLWPVFDGAVALFMEYFYAALRQHGDAALALAEAQRTLIALHSQTADPRAEPLCWASFLLIGGGQGYRASYTS